MSSYFTSILNKATETISTTIDSIKDYCIENPTTSALVATTTSVGGTFLLRRTAFYQRNATIINSLGAVAVLGAAAYGYRKVQPYMNNLLKAKELLEKSNSNRIALTPDQLIAIDQTNIQSFVVTLEALRTSLDDLFSVTLILQATNSARDRQRQLGLTDSSSVLPLFNHYRIHVYSRLVSGIVLTAIVRYFNAISVAVTFRYSETDRIALEQTTLTEAHTLTYETLQRKEKAHGDYRIQKAARKKAAPPKATIEVVGDGAVADDDTDGKSLIETQPTESEIWDEDVDAVPPLTPEEYIELNTLRAKFNSPNESMYLRNLIQSGVTDVLNLVYQSTISVLFPVVSQIVMAQLMETDVPLNYHVLAKLEKAAAAAAAAAVNNSTTPSDQPSLITYPPNEFFYDEGWFGSETTSADLMLLLERTAIKTFATLLQPAEWFIQFQQDIPNTATNSVATATPNTSLPSPADNDTNEPGVTTTTIPITDYILGHGLGCHLNTTLKETPNSTSFAFLTQSDLQSLLYHAVNTISFQHTFAQYNNELKQNPLEPIPAELIQATGGRTDNLEDGPLPPQELPRITYKSLRHSPIVVDHHNADHTPRSQSPLPLLTHALLPIGALLSSVSQRIAEFQPQDLKVLPSAIGIIPTLFNQQQPNPQQNNPMAMSPIGDMFGLSSNPLFGGSNPLQSQAQQPTEQFIMVDSREIYVRRVLQVIGELHSIISCHDVDLLGLASRDEMGTKNGVFANYGQFGPVKPNQRGVNSNRELAAAAPTSATSTSPSNALELKRGSKLAQALDAYDLDEEKEKLLVESVDDIDVMLHPWHYPGQANSQFNFAARQTPTSLNQLPSTPLSAVSPTAAVSTPSAQTIYDRTNALGQLENRLSTFPFFAEVWKDIKLLLIHTGTLLNEQTLKTVSRAGQTKSPPPSVSASPNPQNSIYFTPAMQSEAPSNTLVMTKRIAQLWDTLFPSLEQAQLQQQQQLQLAQQQLQQQQMMMGGNGQPPVPQNIATMLLLPQSASFQLTMSNYHRRYVLETMMKTIAGSIGTEKAGGNFMDFFGLNFGSEELGMLQSLLMGDGSSDGGFDFASAFGSAGADLGFDGGAPTKKPSTKKNINNANNQLSDEDMIKMLSSLNGISKDEIGGIRQNGEEPPVPSSTKSTPAVSKASAPTQSSSLVSPGTNQGLSEEDLLMQSLLSALGGPAPTPKPKKATTTKKKTGTGTKSATKKAAS